MKRTILSSACLVLMILMPFLSTQAQTNEKLKAKIEKIDKEMQEAMVSGNYEKSLSFYAPDALSLPNNGPMVKGIDAIKKSSEGVANSGMKISSFETTITDLISCGDMAIEVGTYKISMSMEGMDQPMSDRGKYITIWEKQSDGSMKVKVETWNTDVNPMERSNM